MEIFFVISGFIIAYSAEGVTARTFAKHRILRLVPAALVCATCTGIGISSERMHPFMHVAVWWLRSVIFWPTGPWIDGSYWTLPIEVAFYAVILVCLASGRSRRVPVAMAILGVVSTLWCVALLHYRWTEAIPLSLLRYGCLFALGAYLDQGFRRGWTWSRALIAAICACGCLAEILLHGFHPMALTLWVVAVSLLAVSVVANVHVHSLLGVRGLRLTRKMGLATYPFYLLHAQLGRLLIGYLHHLGCPYLWALLCTCTVMIACAVAVAEIAEPYVRRVLASALTRASMVGLAMGEAKVTSAA